MAFSFNLAVLCIRDRRMKRLMRRKRRRRDVCKRQKPSLEFPFELQIEILLRLPVKSLMRFKSVSKLWSSLISSQYFTDRFLRVSSPRLYMWMLFRFRNGLFNKVLLSASSSSPDSDVSSFVVDQTHLTIPMMEGYSVTHVYRGLMCFVNGPSARIYNISTRQLVLLPDIEEFELIDEERKSFMYHIGHDPVHDQYKVVCIVSGPRIDDMTEIWVLLLEGDGSSQWRKISSPFQQHYPQSQGVTINGRVHYFASVPLLHLALLVSFDIRSEEISILQEPEKQAFWPHDLIEYGGKIAVFDHSNLEDEAVMNLWVLEDEETKSWSKKTLMLQASQRYLIKNIIVNYLTVQGTNRNGEVIFIVHSQHRTRYNVLLYNIQKNHLRKLKIKETSIRQYDTKILEVIGFDDVENLMYF